MTKKEFKTALLRGQGRCVEAVKAAPEKYRDLVLWACCHEFAYDAQCEGTRTWLVHQLTCAYDDCTPFVEAAVKRLATYRSNGDWLFLHLSELLAYFAADGNETAKAALETEYKKLYHELISRKRAKRGWFFHERDNFEMLCELMATNQESFLRIAADIGRLYYNRPFYDGFDFEQFYERKGKHCLPTLKKAAKTSEDIACYLEKQQVRERELEELQKKRKTTVPQIELPLQNITIDREDSVDWHSVQMEILDKADQGIKVPKEQLYNIYETTFCSCCRERAVRQMGRQRLLTDEMLKECLYDCSEEIRAYAMRRWKRREPT